MVSAVILSFLVYAFLSQSYGYLNTVFFKDNPVQWYTTAKYWPFILTIVHIWQGAGQSSVIYMASIGGIDKGLLVVSCAPVTAPRGRATVCYSIPQLLIYAKEADILSEGK